MLPSRLFFWRWRWGYLLLLIPPILVFAGLYFLRWLLLPTDAVLAEAPVFPLGIPAGYPGLIIAQTLWGASLAVLLLVALSASTFAVVLLREQGARGRRLLWLALTLGLALTAVFLARWRHFDHPVTDMLFAHMNEDGMGDWGGLAPQVLIAGIMSLNRIVWFSTGILLSLAAVSQADFHAERAPSDPAALRRRGRALKLLLYFLSALLVTGVLSVHVLLDMPLALVPEKDPAFDLLSGYANGVILFFGSLLSLLLAAIYLPAALVLHLEADVMAETAAADGEDGLAGVAAWLEKHGLRESPVARLGGLVAVFAPLASSPLFTLVQRASEAIAGSG